MIRDIREAADARRLLVEEIERARKFVASMRLASRAAELQCEALAQSVGELRVAAFYDRVADAVEATIERVEKDPQSARAAIRLTCTLSAIASQVPSIVVTLRGGIPSPRVAVAHFAGDDARRA